MIKLFEGKNFCDDRGYVKFVNDFNFENVKRFYNIQNHQKNFIRAWHGHRKEQKYVYVTNGSIKIGIVDLETKELEKILFLSSQTPQVLFIPEGKANGFMTLEENTNIMFFSTSTLQESLEDDIRFRYDEWNIWNTKDYR
jgi:dTDP-4-dehydrorhamnose 3,5-epimerase